MYPTSLFPMAFYSQEKNRSFFFCNFFRVASGGIQDFIAITLLLTKYLAFYHICKFSASCMQILYTTAICITLYCRNPESGAKSIILNGYLTRHLNPVNPIHYITTKVTEDCTYVYPAIISALEPLQEVQEQTFQKKMSVFLSQRKSIRIG